MTSSRGAPPGNRGSRRGFRATIGYFTPRAPTATIHNNNIERSRPLTLTYREPAIRQYCGIYIGVRLNSSRSTVKCNQAACGSLKLSMNVRACIIIRRCFDTNQQWALVAVCLRPILVMRISAHMTSNDVTSATRRTNSFILACTLIAGQQIGLLLLLHGFWSWVTSPLHD